MTDYEQIALESAIKYCTPALVFFVVQTILCLCCRKHTIRLIPAIIVGFMAIYHICVMIAEIPSALIALASPYLRANVFPAALGVLIGWAIYVVKLVIHEYRRLKNP